MAVFSGSKIIDTGLVLYVDAGNPRSYPGSGTVWSDLSGNENNCTLINGVGYSINNLGSLVFDGVNDILSSVSLPNPNGQLTCEVIMNYNPKATYHNIFERSGGNTPMFWIRPSTQSNAIELNTGSGLVADVGYENQIIIATAIYRSDTSPGLQLYINGQIVKIQNSVQGSWPNPFTISFFNRSNSQTFYGNIFSLKFYNRALTAQEVQQNFEATRGRFGI